MKKLMPCLSLLLVSKCIFASVPNTFVSGTPAKATEVNQNFTSLDNRLMSLEQNESKLNTSFTYTAKNASIGSLLATINGVEYVMGALPFKDYISGNLYKIYLPFTRTACNGLCSNGAEYNYSSMLQTMPLAGNYINGTFSISSFNAAVSFHQSYSWPDSYNSSYTTIAVSSGNISFRSEIKVVLELNINVEGTILKWVPYSFWDSVETANSSTTTKALDANQNLDFSTLLSSSEIDPTVSSAAQAQLDQYKDLINYVRIEKM